MKLITNTDDHLWVRMSKADAITNIIALERRRDETKRELISADVTDPFYGMHTEHLLMIRTRIRNNLKVLKAFIRETN